MSCRAEGPIFLVIIAIFLAIYTFWVDRDAATSTERIERARSVFPVFRREKLSRIEISHDRKTLVLRRDMSIPDGIAWTLVEPPAERLNAVAVENLLAAIEFATIVRPVDADRALFGPTRTRGAISMGEMTVHFELGAEAPTPQGGAYLRVDGTTSVVGHELAAQLVAPVESYFAQPDAR